LLYIDRHLVHEVTSPQAFEGLRIARRPLWRVASILATTDHNTPTTDQVIIADPISRLQVSTLDDNCALYGVSVPCPRPWGVGRELLLCPAIVA